MTFLQFTAAKKTQLLAIGHKMESYKTTLVYNICCSNIENEGPVLLILYPFILLFLFLDLYPAFSTVVEAQKL